MSAWITDNLALVDPSAAAALGTAVRRSDESVPTSTRGILRDGEPRRARPDAMSLDAMLARLHTAQGDHPFWDNRLFRACAAGALGRDDFRFVFSQYYLYSQSFTRCLAALMANCENDLHRARLAENIWEEGGGATPERRHAEIFRRFLREGLGIDVDEIDFTDATRFFVREFLDFCKNAPPAAGSAFLSLGTEGIVPRMYAILLDGLLRAGIPEEHLVFFRIHMDCDDQHAETLERMMVSYAGAPEWLNVCHRAMDYALTLRQRFFEQLYDGLQARRLRATVDRIQRGESLAAEDPAASDLFWRMDGRSLPVYANADPTRGIDFSVVRAPFKTDVLDPRLLRVAAGKTTERHRHPHESLLFVLTGRGRVQVEKTSIEVGPGDMVFVPRWANHQSMSTGEGDLTVLALTDYGLTERAYVGNHLRSTRLKGTQAPRRT